MEAEAGPRLWRPSHVRAASGHQTQGKARPAGASGGSQEARLCGTLTLDAWPQARDAFPASGPLVWGRLLQQAWETAAASRTQG